MNPVVVKLERKLSIESQIYSGNPHLMDDNQGFCSICGSTRIGPCVVNMSLEDVVMHQSMFPIQGRVYKCSKSLNNLDQMIETYRVCAICHDSLRQMVTLKDEIMTKLNCLGNLQVRKWHKEYLDRLEIRKIPKFSPYRGDIEARLSEMGKIRDLLKLKMNPFSALNRENILPSSRDVEEIGERGKGGGKVNKNRKFNGGCFFKKMSYSTIRNKRALTEVQYKRI